MFAAPETPSNNPWANMPMPMPTETRKRPIKRSSVTATEASTLSNNKVAIVLPPPTTQPKTTEPTFFSGTIV